MNTKLFLIIVLIYSITYSQVQVIDDDPNLDAKPELYFWNYTDQDQDLSLELLSTGYTFGYFGEPELAVAEPCSVCGGGLVTHDGSSSDNGSIGWDIISVYNPNGGGQNNRDFFGWGLYKVFHPLSNQYFYLDFRDCGFDRFYPPGSSPDSHIKLLADGELTYAYTDN
ncbi:MAG: hypothetical protein J5I57_04130, partial [Melioribacteraceae bacterium]|nr:hypothetical protein [Melioribacteraceae bacterium]